MTRSDHTPGPPWERCRFKHDSDDLPICGHRRGVSLWKPESDEGFNVCVECDSVDLWPPDALS